ncbi:MAG: RICIN domain-containing protein, partial [Oscillospiraceae bacterium]|nr:RICIN domain-containing protein [Oscillospiraceae bacterium]
YTDVGTTNAEAYTHFVTVGFWEGRTGSPYYDGKAYLYGLNPEIQKLCPHLTPVTATREATCTAAGSITTYCCDCAGILHTEYLPKAEHTELIRKAVAPTESKTGLTQGKYCGTCNTVFVEQQILPALSDRRRTYYDLCENIPTVEDCFAMQGMALLNNYIYTVKIASGNTKAVLFRTSRIDGSTVQMTVDGKNCTTNLNHANDMCAATIGGKDYLFVATLKNGAQGMVAYEIKDTALHTLGVYGLYTASGAAITASGINVYKVEGNKVQLLITSASYSYLTTVDVTRTPGDLSCAFAFRLGDMLADAQAVSGMKDISITVQGSCYADGVFYMPIGMGHSAITADNHGDSDYVILIYPNIDEAIKNQIIGVGANIEASVFIPDSGEIFFEPETVAVADGIVYFNSNRIFLDRTISSVSFLTDRESQTELLEKRAAFAQDGLYILRGSKATDYVLVDPGAEDTHLTTEKITPNESAYFGFESNENGYYYIRSHRSGLYLTVNADRSVTQSKKNPNDHSQLWCIKQVDWPNNLGHVAIVSMLNYEYLNTDSTMTVVTSPSGKTFRMEKFTDREALEARLFDHALYSACYPEETAGMTGEQAKNHWLTVGRKKGYVASIFFDPQYYLTNEKDVAAAYGANNYEGAYEHFVTVGFWEGRQGSLFFDCKDYINYVNFKYDKSYYPNKVAFLNHYYRYGVNEALSREDVSRRGSEEFDLKQIATQYGQGDMKGYAFLVEYISRNIRLSKVKNREQLETLLFDWQYYAAKYPTLTENKVALLPGNTYEEKLHSHWVNYGIEEGGTASPYFDPLFYKDAYTDVGNTTAEAYEHFVTTGYWENRSGSRLYNGETYLLGLNPDRTEVCDHIAMITATQAPTCIQSGLKTTYCCFCSTVTKSAHIPATGHTAVMDKAVAPTCTATGKTEGKHCSVCNAVLTAQEMIPANGHSYVYTRINALVHLVTCQNCDMYVEASHSYENGVCICGEKEIREPVEDAKLKLSH